MNNQTELEALERLNSLAKTEIDLAEQSLRTAHCLIQQAASRNSKAKHMLDYIDEYIREMLRREEQNIETNE